MVTRNITEKPALASRNPEGYAAKIKQKTTAILDKGCFGVFEESDNPYAIKVLDEYREFLRSVKESSEYCAGNDGMCHTSYMARLMAVSFAAIKHNYSDVCNELYGLWFYEDMTQPRLKHAVLSVLDQIIKENSYEKE